MIKSLLILLCFLSSFAFGEGGVFLGPGGDPHWKNPVATTAGLPASGNSISDTRVVNSNQGIYIWSGSTWILVADNTGIVVPGSPSGSLQYNNAGAFAASVVSSPLTFSGGILACLVAGTSQAGCLSSANWNTFNNKQNAFSGLTTNGVIYATSATAVASTGAGTAGYVLTANSGSAPTFQAPGGTPGGTSGQIQYNNSGAFGGFGNWDGSLFNLTGNMMISGTLSTTNNTLDDGSGNANLYGTLNVNFITGGGSPQGQLDLKDQLIQVNVPGPGFTNIINFSNSYDGSSFVSFGQNIFSTPSIFFQGTIADNGSYQTISIDPNQHLLERLNSSGTVVNYQGMGVDSSADLSFDSAGNAYFNTLTTGGPVQSNGTGELSNAAIDLTSQVTGIIPIANGGTGASSIPTWNQNTSGTAAGLSSTLAIASGGTNATTASAALSNLGGAPLASPTFTGAVTTPILKNTAAQTTLTGTAGTAICSEPEQGSSYKKVLCYLSGFTGTGIAADTYTFPTAFTNAPYVYGVTAGVAGATATTTTIKFSLTLVTGFVFAEGY